LVFAPGRIRLQGVNAVTDWNGNLIFSGRGQIEQVRLNVHETEGTSEGSVSADPLFPDWKDGDFRLHFNSPAHMLGIHPVSVKQAGRVR
jgi:hypothetical protein